MAAYQVIALNNFTGVMECKCIHDAKNKRELLEYANFELSCPLVVEIMIVKDGDFLCKFEKKMHETKEITMKDFKIA